MQTIAGSVLVKKLMTPVLVLWAALMAGMAEHHNAPPIAPRARPIGHGWFGARLSLEDIRRGGGRPHGPVRTEGIDEREGKLLRL